MSKNYSASVIQQAKELFEQRVTYKEIAKQLGIPRSNTIYEWKKKFGWQRLSGSDLKNQTDIWETIAQNALDYLKGKGFTSMRDALNVYERSIANVKALKKKKDKPDPQHKLLEILEGKENVEEDEMKDED
jgi:transposase-like protein